MTTYTVFYETERYLEIDSLEYGELTEFKKMCKRNGWKILKIETFKNGLISKREIFNQV